MKGRARASEPAGRGAEAAPLSLAGPAAGAERASRGNAGFLLLGRSPRSVRAAGGRGAAVPQGREAEMWCHCFPGAGVGSRR